MWFVRFTNTSYTSFIEYCFAKRLISGVQVEIAKDDYDKDVDYLLVLTVIPNIDELKKAVEDFGGKKLKFAEG